MLKLTNIRKTYPGFTLDCSLELLPGRITGLIGANGAGKSSTYKAILGLIRIDGGQISVFGKDISELTVEDRQNIGVALAESGFSGYLRPCDIEKILHSFYPGFDSAWFRRKCREYGIPENKKLKEFSTGMKAKFKVIAAASHNAHLLILDEPTAGLDVIARDETLALLRDIMTEDESRSILISSHISGDLESLCDDLYMIDEGKIIFHEDTDVLLSSYGLLKLSPEEYQALDKSHLLRVKEEPYGYAALTDQRRFYQKICPRILMEKGSVDDLILMMKKGKSV